mmetsp:Transcript_15710/g.43342  ORF Transcript_15710/g.43342 Transcript_15710/m.43342 type:complete len:497 (+) Transcript_15710:85-1575(+)
MGSDPVVVQGVPVQSGGGGGFAGALNSGGGGNHTATATPVAPMEVSGIRNYEDMGSKQEVRCRDPVFAVLFYATIAAILIVAIAYGPDALDYNDDDESDNDYEGYVISSVIVAFLSFFVSAGGVAVLMCIPETLIKVSLLFTVVIAGLWMVLSFATGNIGAGILGIIFFALTVCYVYCVWSRIPFATINLVTAMTAVRQNLGTIGWAYLITFIAAGWSICWVIAFVGVFDKTHECDENGNNCSNPSYGLLFVLFLAFFFGQQVLQNTVHVITSGVVGHWWFEPAEAQGFCSAAVNGSFIRATTTSFGSICFGSFVVAVIRALETLANAARSNDDGGIGVCIAECILSCLAAIVEYFNKWAFVYVGIYGYGYCEAGKNVFTLFKNRGWEAIIADDLVANTLGLVGLFVGAIMGCIGLILDATTDLYDDAGGDSAAIAFILGLIIGLFIASIALSTFGSGVNAVIVLFAEAPADFQQNHPDLSNRMRQIWAEVYPGSV